MSNKNNISVDTVIDELFEKFKQEMLKYIKKSNIELNATGVIKYENGALIVDLGNTTIPVDDLPNASGVILSENHKVKVFYNNPDMRDAYIGVAFAPND